MEKKLERQFISTTDLAKLLGISRIAVFKKIQSGKIKAVKVGRNFIIDRKEFPEILEKSLSKKEKEQIDSAIKKTIKEYGETLRLLGKE
jgi:excisionase family DNA binding protein